MGSPQYLFRDLFTVAELEAMLKEGLANGRFTNLSGAGKSSSIEYLDFNTALFELRAEINRLNASGGNRVYQRFGC